MPSSLLHSVSTNPLTKHLSGHKQHDAHEFLVAFLNAIIEVEEKEKGNLCRRSSSQAAVEAELGATRTGWLWRGKLGSDQSDPNFQ